MKKFFLLAISLVLALAPAYAQTPEEQAKQFIDESTQSKMIQALVEKYGQNQPLRIERGVKQVASFWRKEDGNAEEFATFCLNNYVDTPQKLDELFQRLSQNFEVISGHFNKISLDLRKPLDLDMGEVLPIDTLFGGLDLSAHMLEDLFKSKIAFIILLNFPYYSLAEKNESGAKWSRKDWAYARLGDIFTSRVPAAIYQNMAQTLANADLYISEYNIYMGKLVDKDLTTNFSDSLKLISHWGLRDELKGCYPDILKGLDKQKMIYEVMKRIIRQEIPAGVINSQEYQWNPYENKVFKNGKEAEFVPEANNRYRTFLANFHALRQLDKYYPHLPTQIKREFEMGREIPEAEVEKLFSDFCASPQVKDTAKLISQRLGRSLQPFDIWYDGFKTRSSIPQDMLDKIVSQRYPTVAAFESDIKNILAKFGFAPTKAEFLASKMAVEPARGAGHAWGPEMRTEKAHLRTRVPANGMDYQGFNTAMHELGHNVEQILTLYTVDHYMLRGVPNTAFTEAFAFVFQNRDLDILGYESSDLNKKHLDALDTLWSAYEIMGVALVDMKVWNWLYAHPNASAEELKQTVLNIATDTWNQYYAENFGVKDEPILGIYSHMISYPLYLPNYPLGHLIQFQIERFLENKILGSEMERMCVAGRIIPQLWMQKAVGTGISSQPLLDAAAEALQKVR